MAITPLPPLDRTSPTFRNELDSYFGSALPAFGDQANALAAGMDAFAAGGAYAFRYVFDSATADADPGVGKLRLNSATQNASTVLRIDNAIVGGTDISAVFADLLASTSAVKGSVRLVKSADPSKWMILDVAAGSGSGYRNLTVSVRASSAANPFVLDDALMVYIERTGDKGEPGSSVNLAFPVMIVREERPAGTDAGSSIVGQQARSLNTVVKNTISGASLSGSSVTLPAGTYRITGSAPAKGSTTGVTKHKIYLTNGSGNAVLVGTSEVAYVNAVSQSSIDGQITFGGAVTLTLQHSTSPLAVANVGLGEASNAYSTVEVYSQLLIEKVA